MRITSPHDVLESNLDCGVKIFLIMDGNLIYHDLPHQNKKQKKKLAIPNPSIKAGFESPPKTYIIVYMSLIKYY